MRGLKRAARSAWRRVVATPEAEKLRSREANLRAPRRGGRVHLQRQQRRPHIRLLVLFHPDRRFDVVQAVGQIMRQ
ncbi:hypothetical protein [Prosthecobacter sp.]|uniref:hypothetical protein n=1 Tax=Prosthecobacter sp. TaxID=1965333 RepID=UPI0037836C8F